MKKPHSPSNPSITIHRGTHQISGVVTEISDGKFRVFIDIGKNLPNADFEAVELPPIDDLTVGSGENSALFLTHYHGDHVGNLRLVMPGIPVYLGKTAKALHLDLINRIRKEDTRFFDEVKTFEPLDKLTVGDIVVVTLLMTDHSAFDAYMFVIELTGKHILHTGDFRTHDFRGDKPSKMLASIREKYRLHYQRRNHDLSCRQEGNRAQTSAGDHQNPERSEYILVLAISLNIDRIVAFYHAAHKVGHIFVRDHYQKNPLNIVRENHKNKSPFNDFKTMYGVDDIEKTLEKHLRFMEE